MNSSVSEKFLVATQSSQDELNLSKVLFELSNSNHLGSFTILELNPWVTHWFIPGDNRDYEQESTFTGLKIHIFQNSIQIHEVNLYTKI